MKQCFFLILSVFSLLSCDPEQKVVTPDTQPDEMDIVTGLATRDANGQSMSGLGNPNIRPGNAAVFPNPADDVVAFYSQEKINALFLLPGKVDTTFAHIDYSTLLADADYPEAEIAADAVKSFENLDATEFIVSVADLPTGYYRVFYRMEDNSLWWDNLYIDHENPFPQSLNLLVKFWQ